MVETRTRILGIAPYEGMHTPWIGRLPRIRMYSLTFLPGIWTWELPLYRVCPRIPMTVLFPAAARQS